VAVDAGEMEGSQETEHEKRLQEGIGIPHIIVDCTDTSQTPFNCTVEAGKLPSVEQVTFALCRHSHNV